MIGQFLTVYSLLHLTTYGLALFESAQWIR